MATGANQVRVLASGMQKLQVQTQNKQTQNPWLLSVNLPTVQTPFKNSIAFPSRSQTRAVAVKEASDATIMPPAPSDHYMREATTAL